LFQAIERDRKEEEDDEEDGKRKDMTRDDEVP
jgi:hypothetical protein